MRALSTLLLLTLSGCLDIATPCKVVDADGDGWGACESPGAQIPDCDDDNAAIHPGAVDLAANSIDEDCSGADHAAADVPASVSLTVIPDGGAETDAVAVTAVGPIAEGDLLTGTTPDLLVRFAPTGGRGPISLRRAAEDDVELLATNNPCIEQNGAGSYLFPTFSSAAEGEATLAVVDVGPVMARVEVTWSNNQTCGVPTLEVSTVDQYAIFPDERLVRTTLASSAAVTVAQQGVSNPLCYPAACSQVGNGLRAYRLWSSYSLAFDKFDRIDWSTRDPSQEFMVDTIDPDSKQAMNDDVWMTTYLAADLHRRLILAEHEPLLDDGGSMVLFTVPPSSDRKAVHLGYELFAESVAEGDDTSSFSLPEVTDREITTALFVGSGANLTPTQVGDVVRGFEDPPLLEGETYDFRRGVHLLVATDNITPVTIQIANTLRPTQRGVPVAVRFPHLSAAPGAILSQAGVVLAAGYDYLVQTSVIGDEDEILIWFPDKIDGGTPPYSVLRPGVVVPAS